MGFINLYNKKKIKKVHQAGERFYLEIKEAMLALIFVNDFEVRSENNGSFNPTLIASILAL